MTEPAAAIDLTNDPQPLNQVPESWMYDLDSRNHKFPDLDAMKWAQENQLPSASGAMMQILHAKKAKARRRSSQTALVR